MSDEPQQIVTDPAEIRRLQLQVRADPWAANEAATRARLREAGRRSLGENLSSGFDLIESVSWFVGAVARGR